jgi:Putative Flp pilus-assembly TadE/G-like
MDYKSRRGNYSIITALSLVGLCGAAALSIDWGRALLASVQAQHVADSAAEAGVIVLKQGGSISQAQVAAERIAALNRVGGKAPTLTDFNGGRWEDGAGWSEGGAMNGVHAKVSRSGANAIPLPLASLFGHETVSIEREAVAATQNLQVVLVVDITRSWDKEDFNNARAASLTFLDALHDAAGANDLVGMTLFLQRFGWEYTPMTLLTASAASDALVRDKWAKISIGSLAGTYQASWEATTSKHMACNVYATNSKGGEVATSWCSSGSTCYLPAYKDNFTTPSGGCFPEMPRYYSDEGGTDHTTGMEMARTMFEENPDPFAYKAMVVLTDGIPIAYGSDTSSKRKAQSHTEARYRQYKRATAHTVAQIRTDTPALAQEMYEDDQVNTWFVSFLEEEQFMRDAAQGDGYFRRADNSEEIIEIFEDIAHSLPLAVVQ